MAAASFRLIIAALALSASTLAASPASARPSLRPFDAAILNRYATVLRRAQIALVESDPKGHAKQTTVLGYAAAPPALVRELVADPLRYPRYVRNMTRSDVEKRPDGVLINRW